MTRRAAAFWLAVVFGIVFVAAMQMRHPFNPTQGRIPTAASFTLLDPDDFMRLARVERLWQTGRWYESVYPHTNAPYGEELHWTRPLDVLILGLAWPVSLVADQRTAVLVGGTIVGPLLAALTIIVLACGARAFLPPLGIVFAAVVFTTQPTLMHQFMLGRADHHGLQLTLFAAVLACIWRAVQDFRPRAAAYAAGAFAALWLWVSIEAMAGIAAVLAGLGLLWLWENGDSWRAARRFATALAIGALAAVLVERPPAEWLRIEFDRISIVYVAILAMLAASVATVEQVLGSARSQELRWRLGGALSAAAVTVAFVAIVFPRLLRGPFAEMDPRLFPLWLDTIAEFQSIVGDSTLETVATIAVHLGLAVPAIAFAAWRLARGDRQERRLMTVTLAAFGLFVPLACYEIRWTIYPQYLALVPAALLGWRLVEKGWFDRALVRPLRFASLAALLAVLFGGSMIAAAGAAFLPKSPSAPCRWDSIVADLQGPEFPQDRRLIVMSTIFAGPEVHFRSGKDVVATPYASAPGILDTIDVFEAADPEVARRIIERRGVDAIVFCRNVNDVKSRTPGTLLDALYRGDPPPWLRPVRMPPETAKDFMLFAVVK